MSAERHKFGVVFLTSWVSFWFALQICFDGLVARLTLHSMVYQLRAMLHVFNFLDCPIRNETVICCKLPYKSHSCEKSAKFCKVTLF